MRVIEKPNCSNSSVDDYSQDENHNKYNLKHIFIPIKNELNLYHDKNESSSSSNPSEPHLSWKCWLSDTCYGILLKVWSIGSKVWPGLLILFSKAHAVPLVSQTGIFSLPVLQKCHSLKKHTSDVLSFISSAYPKMTWRQHRRLYQDCQTCMTL